MAEQGVEHHVTGCVDQLEDLPEFVGPAGVGVRNIASSELGVVGQKKPDLSLIRTEVEDVPAIRFIHADEQIKRLQITLGDLSSAAGKVYSMTLRLGEGSRIRALARVPAAGACGIDIKQVGNTPSIGVVKKDTFRGRAATDVSKADEENPGSRGGHGRDLKA